MTLFVSVHRSHVDRQAGDLHLAAGDCRHPPAPSRQHRQHRAGQERQAQGASRRPGISLSAVTCHCLLDFSWLVHALSLLQMSDTPHWPCLRMLVLGMAPSGLQRSKNESLSISWVYLFLH